MKYLFFNAIVPLFIATILFLATISKADDVRIVYERPGGEVSIVCPAPGVSTTTVINQAVPRAARFKIIATNLIPTNRARRNEWRYNPNREDGIDVP